MSEDPPRDLKIDEVLPPGSSPTDKHPDDRSEAARILAYWLDEFIRIPGTNKRIGLDPIIALFPGIGDFLASSAGLVILVEGVRVGVSIPVLARMGVNLLLNTVLDVIPVIGPFASAFFKSNSRNLALIRQWSAGQQQQIRRSTWRLFALAGVFGLGVIVLWLSLWAFYIFTFLKWFRAS